MKKYTYTVKGLDKSESGERLLDLIAKALPDVSETSYDLESSTVSFTADFKNNEREKAETRLSGALAALDFELILPEGVKTYTYVGDEPKKTRSMPLAVALSIMAALVAITMLFSYATYDLLSGSGNSVLQKPESSNTVINIENEDIPDYIKELIKLDEIFNQYSYEGLDEEEMGAAILKAYISATGDEYAEYMTDKEFDDYTSDNKGDFVGIGVSIVNSTVDYNGYKYKVLEVISVFDNSPALECGVRIGDCIVYVGGGEDKALVDTLGYTEALNKMLGEAGTEAKFTVLRPDKTDESGYLQIEFSAIRRKVTTESVKYKVSETDSRVGIIHVSGFDMTTAPQFTAAVDALLASGCEYFVFDMRNNPGGALASIEAVLSYFLEKGDVIVSTEYADKTQNKVDKVRVVNYGSSYAGYNVTKDDIGKYKELKGKCVVLTNKSTASAAELFTATFRDYGIAPIVGVTTYGKGCMQNILDLSHFGMKGALRVTTAMYFSKSHNSYHGHGIVPDYEVALSEEALEYNFFLLPEEKDNQLQKAIEVLFK